jgi:hypothetical protein
MFHVKQNWNYYKNAPVRYPSIHLFADTQAAKHLPKISSTSTAPVNRCSEDVATRKSLATNPADAPGLSKIGESPSAVLPRKSQDACEQTAATALEMYYNYITTS